MAMSMALRICQSIVLLGLPMGIFAMKVKNVPNWHPMKKLMNSGLSPISNTPHPEMLEHTYGKPEGSGCGEPGEIAGLHSFLSLPKQLGKPASTFYRAPTATDPGWNGFCEMGWTLCPDAVVNEDYSYYWRGLGPNWVNTAGFTDKFYCLNNGWLKPEIASIVRNFTALKAKGEELCKTKYAAPELNRDELTVMGGVEVATALGKQHQKAAFERGETDYPVMDEEAANIAAAWNCALGDVSCDMAYCNYAYCELPDGTVGVMDECEGWDAVKGMPALYASV